MSLKGKALFGVVSSLIAVSGCQRKASTPLSPTPPVAVTEPPPQPASTAIALTIAEFTAEPSIIMRGQSATLRWQVAGDATSVTIAQVGTVERTGRQRVSPTSSTTYRLTASGPTGIRTALAIVHVSPPPPPVASTGGASVARTTVEERLSAELQDVYFDYDSSNFREDVRATLAQDANALKAIMTDFPIQLIVIEGHCDERRSAEYNLALGDRRAMSVRDFLAELGITPERLRVISYGKEQPQCNEST